jgi:ankyrin repeat protein
MTILNNAVSTGDLETVRKLIEVQGYSVDYTGFTGLNETPLTVAAFYGQRKVMDYLIQKGADINLKGSWGFGSSPIQAGISAGHTQTVVTLLIKEAALPAGLHRTDIANEYLLKAAGLNDTWSIDKIMAHTEADINVHDNFMKRTPLHNAVMNDSFDATNKIIAHGGKVNSIDIHGWTPLHYAASNSDSQFAKLLIEKGAKINALDYGDRTPLFAAMQMGGEEELISLLVKNGAKVNHADKDGITVLDLAVINDDADMIKCLVSHGAKISAGTGNTTPLEFAAQSGKLQAIEALIEMGSSLTHKNAQGKTALELAFKAGEMGAVNTLIMHGAEVPSYIQDKLDTLKTVGTDQVLPNDIISTPNLHIEDNSDVRPTNTTQPILTENTSNTYAQPIGPVLGALDVNDPAFGG